MKSNHLFMLFCALSIFFFAACGGESPSSESSMDEPQETAAAPTEIIKSEFSASPEFPGATLALEGCENGTFNFTVSNYELGLQTDDAPQKMCANSAKGQHIHLIVDDKPYAAKYVSTFDHEVADGDHYLLAFLSRSYHESIKTDDAHVAVKSNFAGKTMKSSEPITDPMLFYSRPKGEYIGKANTDKIMLDFYLVNTTLAADGNKVKVEVNGEEKFTLAEWKPIFIEGLPMGDNRIKLTLVDNDGHAIDTPLNPVERVFTLKADPLEES